MAVAITQSTDNASGALIRPRLFTINDVVAMVRAGILRDDEHIELIEGQIVEMHAQGTRHVWAVIRLTRMFNQRDDVLVSPQSTFELHPRGGPGPDVVVLRARASDRRRPSPGDALLVIEVSDSSLAYDRQVKTPLYAHAGVPEYWIVDLRGERVEVHREASDAGYRASRFYLRGESVSPAFAPDMAIEVDAILGSADIEYDDEADEPD